MQRLTLSLTALMMTMMMIACGTIDSNDVTNIDSNDKVAIDSHDVTTTTTTNNTTTQDTSEVVAFTDIFDVNCSNVTADGGSLDVFAKVKAESIENHFTVQMGNFIQVPTSDIIFAYVAFWQVETTIQLPANDTGSDLTILVNLLEDDKVINRGECVQPPLVIEAEEVIVVDENVTDSNETNVTE